MLAWPLFASSRHCLPRIALPQRQLLSSLLVNCCIILSELCAQRAKHFCTFQAFLPPVLAEVNCMNRWVRLPAFATGLPNVKSSVSAHLLHCSIAHQSPIAPFRAPLQPSENSPARHTLLSVLASSSTSCLTTICGRDCVQPLCACRSAPACHFLLPSLARRPPWPFAFAKRSPLSYHLAHELQVSQLIWITLPVAHKPHPQHLSSIPLHPSQFSPGPGRTLGVAYTAPELLTWIDGQVAKCDESNTHV